jgi:hypothetical protein
LPRMMMWLLLLLIKKTALMWRLNTKISGM